MLRELKADEEGRIRSLHRYAVLDSEEEQPFEHVVSLVEQILAVPICAVSLVDRHRQWFKAKRGLDVCETNRDISFCTHAIKYDGPFVVEDASKHPIFKDNPLVTDGPKIRAYLGIPLRTPDGYNLGSLCAIDTKPRVFTETDIATLQKFAEIVMDELELRQLATRDTLTGLLTRRAWRDEAERERAKALRYKRPMSVAILDIDHFKTVNDTHGHPAGDLVIQALADTLRTILRESDLVGRYGGEEFIVLMPEATSNDALEACERLRVAVNEKHIIIESGIEVDVTVSIGYAEMTGDEGLEDLIALADRSLYEAKRNGRNRTQGRTAMQKAC